MNRDKENTIVEDEVDVDNMVHTIKSSESIDVDEYLASGGAYGANGATGDVEQPAVAESQKPPTAVPDEEEEDLTPAVILSDDNDDDDHGDDVVHPKEDADNNHNDVKPVKPDNEEEDNDDDGPKGPTFFSDDKGNLKFVNLVVRNPCMIFCSILAGCLVVTFMLIAFVFQNGNPFTNPENESDLNDIRSIQYDSLRLAQETVQAMRNAEEGTNSVRPQSEVADITYWTFEAETEAGLFGSAESIEAMKEAFDIFLQDQAFENYCLLKYRGDGQSECDVPLTPLSMYFASEWDTDMVAAVIETLKVSENVDLFNQLALCYTRNLYCDLVPQDTPEDDIQLVLELAGNLTSITSKWDMKGPLVSNFDQVTELASYLMQISTFKGLVDFGFDNDFGIDNPKSIYSRGIVFWGGPLTDRGTMSPDEKEEADKKDEEVRKDFILDNYLDEMNEQGKGGTHETVNSYYFMIALILDVILAIVIQDAMLAFFSLAFVFIWLRINTGSWFLAGVGIFEIMFSIPVAWFIFNVVFQIQYFATLNALAVFIVAAIGADDIFIFMDAYKQSKFRNPHNLETLETRLSWVYRRTGTAMAITSATTCCAFLCTLITPLTSIQSFGIFAAVVIFIDYVLVMSLFCAAVVIYHDRYEDRGCCGCCCTNCSKSDPCPTAKAKQALEAGEQDTKGDVVGDFFRNRVAGFIQVPLHRAVLAVGFLSWISIALWQTSLIEPTKEAEQFLDKDHPLQKSVTILNNEFPTADEDVGLSVYFSWGLGEVDRSGVNLLLDPENYGTPTFLDNFEFNEECQTALLKECDKFRSSSEYEGLIKRKGGLGVVSCFVEELAAYNVKRNLDDCEYVRTGGWKNESWQIPLSELKEVMDGFLEQRMSCYDDSASISLRYENDIGWDGQRMLYAAIAVEDNVLDPFSQDAEQVARHQYNQYVAIAEALDETVSKHCAGPVIMTDLVAKFVFMNNQAIYVKSAIQSSILGVAIAFVVLLFSTHVLHVAFFASLSICSVLVSVTGTMVLLGWTLGAIESILIGIIAGFSVDYVVHLAHAYETARGNTDERVREAFGDMGISVFNGMVTSVAAAVPLFFCQLQFFAKFGTFLCLTIAYSWIFANFGFMSLLAQLKIPLRNKGWRL